MDQHIGGSIPLASLPLVKNCLGVVRGQMGETDGGVKAACVPVFVSGDMNGLVSEGELVDMVLDFLWQAE